MVGARTTPSKLAMQSRASLPKALAALILFGIPPTSLAATAQSAVAEATCPSLKLEIRIPEDVVRPEASVLLEMKLANTGRETAWVPSASPDFWSYEFELRDAEGALVPQTAEWRRALAERPAVVTVNVQASIAPGASLTKTVLLEKLYDLSKAGQYSLRVSSDSFRCGNLDIQTNSNLIHFTVGALTKQSPESRASIAIFVSAPRARLPVGWAVPIDITIQNKSGHSLRWAVDNPPNTAPDEFLTGMEVFDAGGKPRPAPKEADPNWSRSRFRADAALLEIPSGKSAERIVLIGDLFDISKPGKYGARVALAEPGSDRRIESDLVSFEIDELASSGAPAKGPPFLVTVQSEHFIGPDPSNVLICVGNLSDRDIRMDNASTKDFVFVEDNHGDPVGLTEAQQKAEKLVDLRQELAGFEQCCTWHTVKPRKALCGGLTVGAMYQLLKGQTYRIRVDRYDEPDATPGQKLADLPIVHSNWLTIFNNFAAASEK